MDVGTIVASVASSLGISVSTAAWLSRSWITHRLTKDIENYRGALSHRLEEHKSALTKVLDEHKSRLDRERDSWQADLRRETESALGDKAAEREYFFSARKRLYEAIGPLRFQLLLACREAAERVKRHGVKPFPTELNGYYGQSTLFRILRPLAVSELIERQVACADFSVDPAALEVLRFRRAVFLALTDADVILDHPGMNWHRQEQHIFSDYLRRAQNTVIVSPTGVERVMHFHEFEDFLNNEENLRRLHPFPRLLDKFSPENKPILWARLVAMGYMCKSHVASEGRTLGFGERQFPIRELIMKSQDSYLIDRLDRYEEQLRALIEVQL
jgi:hypothetical protein